MQDGADGSRDAALLPWWRAVMRGGPISSRTLREIAGALRGPVVPGLDELLAGAAAWCRSADELGYNPPTWGLVESVNETARALFGRGAQAGDVGDYVGAISAFRQILDLEDVANDDKAMACVNLAIVYERMGDDHQTLTSYETASELAIKTSAFVGTKWAAYLVDRHRDAEAIPVLTRLVESPNIGNDDKAMMCVNLATVYDHLGDVDQALAWYQTGSDLAVKNREWIEGQRAEYLRAMRR